MRLLQATLRVLPEPPLKKTDEGEVLIVVALDERSSKPRLRIAVQDAAMRSRLKIPMFFAYDVIHGHQT